MAVDSQVEIYLLIETTTRTKSDVSVIGSKNSGRRSER